jgi:mono/diheme cytochrome c family protein
MPRFAANAPRLAGAVVLAGTALPTAGAAAASVGFVREVRPLLSDRCFSCHGPDGQRRKAGLRLDERAAAVKQGAIVPGRPDEVPSSSASRPPSPTI